MTIVDFYNAHKVEPGDVLVVTIKVMVQYDRTYKLYRCPWPNAEIGSDGTPQGDKLYGDEDDLRTTAETLMNVLTTAEGPRMQ